MARVNMSYCQFRNTLDALKECSDFCCEYSSSEELYKNLSDKEQFAAKKLFLLCSELAETFVE